MRIDDKSFNIILTEHIHFSVTPTYADGKTLTYELSIDGKVHGSLIPEFDEKLGLIWRTEDNIDTRLVNRIGRLIDDHEA